MNKTIGILGSGETARMLAQAGHAMGLRLIIPAPGNDARATGLGESIQAGWEYQAALTKLCQQVDIVAVDFEDIPVDVTDLGAHRCCLYPSPDSLMIGQDRLRAKQLLQKLDIPVSRFCAVASRPELQAAVERLGLPCVLKTRRPGSEAPVLLRFQEDLERAWQALGGADLMCEVFVRFGVQCSIIAARGKDGQIVCWPLSCDLHRDGGLMISMAPAFGPALQSCAEGMVRRLLEHLEHTGVMALGLFVKGDEVFASGFTPGPHDSGYWTVNGARTSQYENHLDAICGMPLGNTDALGHALMFNLLEEMPRMENNSYFPASAHWHDCHQPVRGGRKIGYLTLTAQSEAGIRAKAAQLAAMLGVAAEVNLEALLEGLKVNFPEMPATGDVH